MAIAPNSAGFGIGPNSRGFGYGPFGHGSWIDWTVPRMEYGYRDELAFDVNVLTFDDDSEERWRRSTDQARNLQITLGTVDSSAITTARSFYQAAVGPLNRFRVTDFRTGSSMIVRFAGPLTVTMHDGALRRIEPIPVTRAHPYDVGTSTVGSGGDWDTFIPSRTWRPDAPVPIAGLSTGLGIATTTPAILSPTGVMVGVPFHSTIDRRLRSMSCFVCSAATSTWMAFAVYEQGIAKSAGNNVSDAAPVTRLWRSVPFIPRSIGITRRECNIAMVSGRTYFLAVTVDGSDIPPVRSVLALARAPFLVYADSMAIISHYVTSGVVAGACPNPFFASIQSSVWALPAYFGRLSTPMPALGMEFVD